MAGTRKSRCYIGQEDLLAPFMTTGELMDFASRLKLPSNYTSKQRAVIIDELLHHLGLEKCIDTRTECLSGGQKKRLSIALELINNPSIIFLDEPTSGLDIVTAGVLIRLLSKLSQTGRTIVVTIHQPSATLFALFDKVYFLAEGKCIYQGGPGAHLVHFLEQNNFICPTNFNPADYLIEIVEDDKNTIQLLSDATENGKVSWYSKDVAIKTSTENADVDNINLSLLTSDPFIQNRSRDCTSFWLQFTVILSRIILQGKRNKAGLKIHFLHYTICAFVVSTLFYQTANNGSEFTAHLRLCISLILFHSYSQQMAPVVYYPFEVKLLKREHFNQWYSLLPYYLALKLSKIPILTLLLWFHTLAVYYSSGLPWELYRFTLFFAVSLVTSFVALALGLTIGALFNATNGSIIGAMILSPILGLACYGFDFMRTVPLFMQIIVRFSFMRSGVYALVLIIYSLNRQPLKCPEEIIHCHFSDPKVALYFLDLQDVDIWKPIGDLMINLFFFWLAFYLALRWRLRS
nr:ATP-binding cassette sub-family G member 4 isoform X2 [Halyomorpha halys]